MPSVGEVEIEELLLDDHDQNHQGRIGGASLYVTTSSILVGRYGLDIYKLSVCENNKKLNFVCWAMLLIIFPAWCVDLLGADDRGFKQPLLIMLSASVLYFFDIFALESHNQVVLLHNDASFRCAALSEMVGSFMFLLLVGAFEILFGRLNLFDRMESWVNALSTTLLSHHFFMDYIGAPVDRSVQGQSLVPVVFRGSQLERDEKYSEIDEEDQESDETGLESDNEGSDWGQFVLV